jgi:hypothetical protein
MRMHDPSAVRRLRRGAYELPWELLDDQPQEAQAVIDQLAEVENASRAEAVNVVSLFG